MGICILGMGDCNTPSSTDISNITNNDSSINNSIKSQINQDCNQLVGQSNVINMIGSTVKKLSASQKNATESMCIMQSIFKNNISSDVTNKLLDKIKNNIETSGGLLGSPASNTTISKILTTNKTSIDNSKFNDISKKCILQQNQSNLLNIIGSTVDDTNTDQTNKSFLKCMSRFSDDTLIKTSDLSDTIQQQDTASKTTSGDLGTSVSNAAQGIGSGVSTGAQGIGSGASSIISSYIYPLSIGLVICCLACLILIAFMIMNSGKVSELANVGATIYKNK